MATRVFRVWCKMNPDDPTLQVPRLSPRPEADLLSDSAIERMLAAGAQPAKKDKLEWTPPSPEEIQRLLPDYTVQALVGRGGMGAVYRGVQRSLDRAVAIKILPAEMAAGDPQFAARFKQEAKAMAKLSHANIVPVHDFGEVQSSHLAPRDEPAASAQASSVSMLYFVMEFIDGTDLQQIMKSEGYLPPKRAAAIISQVCDALEFAHENGIVHRDIKPSNVMMDKRGQVKVADFGLAKSLHANEAFTTAATMTGTIMGTMAYMAPEQAQGKKVDHRADIYSLGAMFYEMLTGEVPHGAVEAPSRKIEIDVRMDHIVLKALAQDPERRYQHASEVKSDVTRVTDQPVVSKKSRKGKRLALAAIIVAGLAAGAFFGIKELPNLKSSSATVSPSPAFPVSKSSPGTATKHAPFVNTLGMKFVPVPIVGGPTKGQRVLFSVWETRVQDYEAYTKEMKLVWRKPDFVQEPTHPAVNVSWDDAQAFCVWLTQRERKAGTIHSGDSFRLPSDYEWSCAVGIGAQEVAPQPMSEKHRMLSNIYPWGAQWPPPMKSGNFSGEEALGHYIVPARQKSLTGYRDTFIATAPVGSYSANLFGIFDLSGNVWEICGDLVEAKTHLRVTRGGSWFTQEPQALLSSNRNRIENRNIDTGFRCVLLLELDQSIASAAGAFPNSDSTNTPATNKPARRHDPAISRECAELALSKGASVVVNGSQSVLPGQVLPAGDLQLHQISFRPIAGQRYEATPQDLIQMVRASEIIQVTCYNMSTALSAESCAAIAALPRLSRLAFRDSRLDESWLRPFRGHASLQRLELMGSGIGDATLEHFAECAELKLINVAETAITPQAFAKLKARESLTELGYGQANQMVTGEIKELLALCPQLTRFISAGNFTTDALAGIAAMKQLAWLDFNACHIDEHLIKALKVAPALTKLAFGHGTKVTPAAWEAMAELSKLETLMLVSSAWPEALERTLPAFPHLKRLELDRVSGLDAAGLDRLRAALPGCHISIVGSAAR